MMQLFPRAHQQWICPMGTSSPPRGREERSSESPNTRLRQTKWLLGAFQVYAKAPENSQPREVHARNWWWSVLNQWPETKYNLKQKYGKKREKADWEERGQMSTGVNCWAVKQTNSVASALLCFWDWCKQAKRYRKHAACSLRACISQSSEEKWGKMACLCFQQDPSDRVQIWMCFICVWGKHTGQ